MFLAFGVLAFSGLKADEIPPCFTQLERQFFAFRAVEQALALYEVPQGAWGHIVDELQRETGNIHQRVMSRTAGMKTNPFSHPFNRRGAYNLLDGTLYEILVQVLDKWGVRDPDSRRGIFQYLKEQSAPLIRSCLGENVTMSKIGQ